MGGGNLLPVVAIDGGPCLLPIAPKTWNEQVTDSVTQVNTKVIGETPAMATCSTRCHLDDINFI